jgi:hypothetical protein
MLPRLLLPPAVTAFLLAGCGSERFDPTTVSLTGIWKLDEVTDPAPPNEGPRCRLEDVPLNFEEIEGGEWIGFSQPGGTRRCQQPGGPFGPATPYDPEYTLLVRKNGERITATSVTSGLLVYTGRLTGADAMSGDVSPESDGRQGTWSAQRE